MELNHDWRGYRSIFQPRRKPGARPAVADPFLASGPIHAVVDGPVVLAALGGESEDLSTWVGRSVDDLATSFPERALMLADRKEVDAKLASALTLSHLHDQTAFLRERSEIQVVSRAAGQKKNFARKNVEAMTSTPGHFLLSGIQSWWAKVLPSAYGLFIRLEPGAGASANATGAGDCADVFVLVRRGRLELFHCPDLSVLGLERVRQPAAIVRYLTEKHGVPVQGLVASARDWAEWSEAGSEPGSAKEAWRRLALAIQANEAQLVPFRWQLMTLVATRAFFGL